MLYNIFWIKAHKVTQKFWHVMLCSITVATYFMVKKRTQSFHRVSFKRYGLYFNCRH